MIGFKDITYFNNDILLSAKALSNLNKSSNLKICIVKLFLGFSFYMKVNPFFNLAIARCLWLKERVLTEYKTRSWAKAVTLSANVYYFFVNMPCAVIDVIKKREQRRKSSKRKWNGQSEFRRFSLPVRLWAFLRQ